MTITRETLELAALACGIQWYGAFEDGDGTAALDIALDDVLFWHPHIDNNDNATMCDRLTIGYRHKHIDEQDEAIVAWGCRELESDAVMIEVWAELRNHNNDRGTARRYATTMVAAEIGRRMKEPNNAE